MPHPVKENVKQTLDPFHTRIRLVVERAWAEWRRVVALRAQDGMPPVLYPRTIANYVFDAIARYAISEFSGDSSVNLDIDAQTIRLYFKGSVLGRFKKGDECRLGQNIPTQKAIKFEDAEAVFPGFPPETAKVEFIWLANEIFTRLEHVLVVTRDGDRLVWEYEIEDKAAGGAGALVIPFKPVPPAPPADDDADDLVTPKKPAATRTENNKD